MKPAKDIEELCKKLKPVIGDKADKLWYMYLAEDDKGRKDRKLISLPDLKHGSKGK